MHGISRHRDGVCKAYAKHCIRYVWICSHMHCTSRYCTHMQIYARHMQGTCKAYASISSCCCICKHIYCISRHMCMYADICQAFANILHMLAYAVIWMVYAEICRHIQIYHSMQTICKHMQAYAFYNNKYANIWNAGICKKWCEEICMKHAKTCKYMHRVFSNMHKFAK